MRLGIRGKLVGTLMLAGILPLALSLGVALYVVQKARNKFIGQSFRAMARQQSEHISTLLSAQVDFLWVINQLPGTSELLRRAADRPASRPALDEQELAWPSLLPGDTLVRGILDNDIARRWQAIQRQRPRFAEIIVTDRFGRLVAATERPAHYFYGDEAWWKHCWAEGRGRISLSVGPSEPPLVVAAADAPGTVVYICMPVYSGHEPAPGQEPLGIMRASLHFGWVMEQLRQTSGESADDLGREIWLVGRGGQPIAQRSGGLPPLPEELLHAMRSSTDGYLVSRRIPEHDVVGFAQVLFPARGIDAPQSWHVLVTGQRDSLMGSGGLLIWSVLLGGLAVIAFCFVVGLWVAQREIIRPLLVLRQGAGELEQGRLDFRLKDPGKDGSVFRDDEIGYLARDFNQMAAELSRNVAELDKANRLKQRFIDLASHELRTPITYIVGATELAQRQGSPEAPLLGRIAAKGQRLNHIVENMFKLLQSGLFESTLNLGPVDIEQLVRGAAQEVEPFLRARRQGLEMKLPGTLDPITADAEKVRDILDNLLSNAIRFSPDGSSLCVEVVDRDSAVEIVMSDSGPGIAPEDMPYIFEPFYRGQTALAYHRSGQYEYMTRGIGLGLSVVKRFVDLHGGAVSAESTEEGARFHVLLPKHPKA